MAYIRCTKASGGSNGVYVGTTAPSSSLGQNGEYYYQRIIHSDTGTDNWDISGSGASISGYKFTTAEACSVVGLRVYNRGASRQVTAGLYESDGTVIEEITATVGSKWTSLMFNSPHQLTSDTTYLSIADWGETGHSVYSPTYFMMTDNRIDAASLKGIYGSITGTVDNQNIYGCDILLSSNSGDYYEVTDQYYKVNNTWAKIG